MQQEINALREQNADLVSRISQYSDKSSATGSHIAKDDTEELKDIENVLRDIEVDLPVSANDGKGGKNNLLDIFYNARRYFVNGITNQHSMDDGAQFLFFNVAPRLQIYGLIVNEKVVGKVYRRVVVSEKGMALLARIERRAVAAKVKAKADAKGKANEKILVRKKFP